MTATTTQLLQTLRETLRGDTLTPLACYRHLRQSGPSFLFESMEGNGRTSQFTVLGRNPLLTFRHRNGTTHIAGSLTGEVVQQGNPFDHLKTLLQSYTFAEQRIFRNGLLAGYIGFETFRHIEPTLSLDNPDLDDLPDILLVLPGEVLVFDNYLHTLDLIIHGAAEADLEARRAVLKQELLQVRPSLDIPQSIPVDQVPRSEQSDDDYMKGVDRARHYILEGDIFQTVLSRRKTVSGNLPVLDIYRELRRTNPSPYMYLLELDDVSIVGASPETMVKCENDTVLMRPIAGTRRRGHTPEEDHNLALDLLADQKELAEHDMLVDLGRNDVGKVSIIGSVQVPEYRKIEHYSHVMHIVSTVTGHLRKDCDVVDVFTACFPAGTVSGAPKIRAIEIINDLEQHARGPYAGAVGYFDFAGRTDTCIVIRTLVSTKDKAWWQAGAGIVADSISQHELEETENKGRVFMQILGQEGA